PKGWYDAGDYGKYIVNAGITTYFLMALHENFPEYSGSLNLNIPESDGELPDVLGEVKWELDWFFTMQDEDGGVYHKLTTKGFVGNVMPSAAGDQRYFMPKSVTATFDFAAIMAMAARIYREYDEDYADSCLSAALAAWEWGKDNRERYFDNPDDVETGEYGDSNERDEMFWAASELYVTTGEDTFSEVIADLEPYFSVPGWPNVASLGWFTLAKHLDDPTAEDRIISEADDLLDDLEKSPYKILMESGDFYWGSNGVNAGKGATLINAFLETGDKNYIEGALSALDYILGRNPNNYSFVTGFGDQTPKRPHHRPSIADGIREPVPGFLVGGPNAAQQDIATCGGYPEKSSNLFKALSWIDKSCSYAANEIAINWNGAGAYLAGGIEAVYTSGDYDFSDMYRPDTIPPAAGEISVDTSGGGSPVVIWSTDSKTLGIVTYSQSPDMSAPEFAYSFSDTLHEIRLDGVVPGEKYYYESVSVDSMNNRDVSSPDSFTVPSSEIFDALGNQFPDHSVSGESLLFEFSCGIADEAFLVHKTAGDSEFDTLAFTESSGEFAAELSGVSSENGLIYRIKVCSPSDTLITPVASAVTGDMPEYEKTLDDSMYYMLSLPIGMTADTSSSGVFESLFKSDEDWTFLAFDPESGEYKEGVSPLSSPGWFFCRNSEAMVLDYNRVSPDTSAGFQLAEGWNMIGNPYAFDVYLKNASVKSEGVEVPLYSDQVNTLVIPQVFIYRDTTKDWWNDGWYETNRDVYTHKYDKDFSVEPWTGAWIYSYSDDAEIVFNPSSDFNTRENSFLKKSAFQSDRWIISFSVSGKNGVDKGVCIGTDPEAENGYDPLDTPKPPSINSGVSVELPRIAKQRFKGTPGRDIREDPGMGWEVRVTGEPGMTGQLQWDSFGDIPDDLAVSDDLGNRYEIGDNSLSFDLPENGERVFKVASGINTEVSDMIRESGFRYKKRGGRLLIDYRIAGVPGSKSDVSIELLDIKGRVVNRVLNQRKAAGEHSVSLNWSDSFVSGMYILRFRTGDLIDNKKVVLID
ncbi:MAG: glycoside hydrolase family 9 protein, partial [Chitinivibrionales bacterium]